MCYKKIKTNIITLLLLLSLSALSSAQEKAGFKKFYTENKDYKSLIVAKVGNIKITAEEFLASYEFGPAFVKRENNSTRRYLDFMIYEKLLAYEGYQRRLDTSKDVSMILSDIEGDLATEELYKADIWNNLSVDGEELSKGVEEEQINLELGWIYKPNFEEIKEQYLRLKEGETFDSLYNEQLLSGIKREDRFLKTTAFGLKKKNPTLYKVIDTLKKGMVTPPVQTPDGFYILKLQNMYPTPITTETEMEKLKYEVSRAILKEKADSISDRYVQNLMLKEKPVIKRETFNILKAHLGSKMLPPEKYNEWDMGKNILPFYPGFNPGLLTPYEKNILVEKKNGGITLEDFMKWFTTREPYIKLDKSSHEAFFLSLQSVVWQMVRDRVLMHLAHKRGFEKSADVLLQKKWWKDKLVYSKVKLEMASQIKIDSSEVKEFYKGHLSSYKDEKGNTKSFEEVKEEVKNDFYSYQYMKKIVGKVLGLKERVPIKINEELLKTLPVTDEEDPRAIDVYSVKTGGTFMRQAYPVIDYEWQFWN